MVLIAQNRQKYAEILCKIAEKLLISHTNSENVQLVWFLKRAKNL